MEGKTDLELFLGMLERASISHSTRHDFDPDKSAVEVEHGDEKKTMTEWQFDSAGNLVAAVVSGE